MLFSSKNILLLFTLVYFSSCCLSPPCNQCDGNANFDYAAADDNSTEILQNTSIKFLPELENAISYSWNFGDNTPTQTATKPTHAFAEAKTYTIELTVTLNDEECTIGNSTRQLVVSNRNNAVFAFIVNGFNVNSFVANDNEAATAQAVALEVQPFDMAFATHENSNVFPPLFYTDKENSVLKYDFENEATIRLTSVANMPAYIDVHNANNKVYWITYASNGQGRGNIESIDFEGNDFQSSSFFGNENVVSRGLSVDEEFDLLFWADEFVIYKTNIENIGQSQIVGELVYTVTDNSKILAMHLDDENQDLYVVKYFSGGLHQIMRLDLDSATNPEILYEYISETEAVYAISVDNTDGIICWADASLQTLVRADLVPNVASINSEWKTNIENPYIILIDDFDK